MEIKEEKPLSSQLGDEESSFIYFNTVSALSLLIW